MPAALWRTGCARLSMLLGRSDLAGDPVRRDRSDGIDVLRALFALWVVLAHLVPWSALTQGPDAVPHWLQQAMRLLIAIFQPAAELHPAVLGFIVLSGYCIHRAGLRAPAEGAITGYAIRRFFRIAPLYYLAIAAGLAGFVIAGWHDAKLASALSGTTQFSGACLAAKGLVLSAVFPSLYQCGFLGNAPLATVLVEIVLYILYAAAFAGLVWRGRERLVWLGCGALFLLSLPLVARSPGLYGWWQNGSVFGFLPYWWLGVAFVSPAFAEACRRRWWLILLGWAALTALLTLGTPLPPAVAELRKLVFALGVGILICAADNLRLRGFHPLVPIGRAGYGLYAVHAPLTYTLAIYGVRWWLVLAVNIAAGLVLHCAVERPLIAVGRRLRLRLAPPAAMVRAEAAD